MFAASEKASETMCTGKVHKWSESHTAKAIELYNSGLSMNQIASRFGFGFSTVQRHLKESGIPLRGKGRYRITGTEASKDALDGRILELHKQGLSDYEIAPLVGVSRFVVNYRLNKMGIQRGKGKSFLRECVCPRCGKRFKTMIKNQEYCSETCRDAACWQRRDDTKRVNTDGQVEEITLREIYDRDRGRCYICGCRTDWNDYHIVNGLKVVGPRYPSRDHIIALHNGGTHTRDNIRLACWECNSLKSDKGQMRLAI